jgi:hypothetical protein
VFGEAHQLPCVVAIVILLGGAPQLSNEVVQAKRQLPWDTAHSSERFPDPAQREWSDGLVSVHNDGMCLALVRSLLRCRGSPHFFRQELLFRRATNQRQCYFARQSLRMPVKTYAPIELVPDHGFDDF